MNSITPINYSNIYHTRKTNGTNAVNRSRKISFGQNFSNEDNITISVADIVNAGKEMATGLAYAYCKRGEYQNANNVLNQIGENFIPGYYIKDFDETLLEGVFNPVYIGKIKSLFHRKDRKEIIKKIIMHEDFSIDKTSVDYLKFAIKHNNPYMVELLCARFGTDLDRYNHSFADYIAQTKNKKIIQILTECRNKPLKSQKNATTTQKYAVGKEKFEEEDIQQFKLQPDDMTPSSLDELGGMKKAKQEICDFIIKPWSKNIREKLKENNIPMPNGFLMYGPPGCGKTYIVEVIAKQTGYLAYKIGLQDVGDFRAYGTEKALKRVFEALESQYQKNHEPCILFLDEIDSIAASRGKSGTDWKRDEVNCLISLANKVADKGIILIGATNYLDNIDNAMLRAGRFDKKIEIGLPDEEERTDILTRLIGMKKIALPLLPKINELVKLTEDMNCSEISAVVDTCARQAIYDDKRTISVEDFKTAIKKIESEKNKRKPIGFSVRD